MTQKPKQYDTTDIVTEALLADTTGQVWQDIITDARQHDPGSFVTEEDEFCKQCGTLLTYWNLLAGDNHYCYSEADRLADEAKEQADQAWSQENFDRLYDEAVAENLDRLYDDAVAEDYQRQIDAEIEAEERQQEADEEAYREMYEYYTSLRFKLRLLLEKIWRWRS